MTVWPMHSGITWVVSRHTDPVLAARQLADHLHHDTLGFVLFFCSAEYALDALAQALAGAFPDTPMNGCTTAGEITPDGYDRGSVVAIGFDRRLFTIETALVDDLEQFVLSDAQHVVERLIERCRRQNLAPINGHSLMLTLLDGLSSREEQVLATLNTALGSIPSFGGSAGDDNRLAHTHVYHGGRFHAQAAVMIMINTPLPFEVFSTHHLEPMVHKLVVTDADHARRRVLELNGLPAAEVYAALVGYSVDELTPRVFAQHPLGVQLAGSHYIRAIQRVNDDGSLSFYCAVETGIVLTAMQPAPLLDDLASILQGLAGRLGGSPCIIACDCFLRRMALESLGQLTPASRLLRQFQVVGFNTYGEQHGGMHVNQTLTGVAFGAFPAR